MGDAIREANFVLIGLAAFLLCGTLYLRALRWRVLFHPLRDISTWHLFGSLNVAYLINNVLPLQPGDLGRAYLLSELEGISATRSLSTVIVERILDVLTLLAILAFLVPFVDIPHRARIPAILLAVGVGTVALVLVLASHRRGFTMRQFNRLLRFAPKRTRGKLTEMMHSALDAFSVLSNPRVAIELAGWSALTWMAVGCVVFTGTEAFGLDIGFGGALFLLVATTFGFLVPSSPGAFGVYHAIVIKTLTDVFNIDNNLAVSYALVIHLVFYLPPMFIGATFLWIERQLWQRSSFLEKLRSFQGEQQATTPSAPGTAA